ncbi:MAG TPA: transglycosylase SLT domain-containing protein [bacterium]|nr:transglycosylase SLT domain-containing protein [bacterium]
MRRRTSVGVALVVILWALIVAPESRAKGTLLKLSEALQWEEVSFRTEHLAELFRQKDYETVIRELDNIAMLFPATYRAARLDYLKAESLAQMGRFAQAARLFIAVEASSGGLLGEEALCDAVLWAARAKQWGLAEEAAEALSAKYPPSEQFKEAISGLAEALYDAGQYAASLSSFEQLAAVFQSDDGFQFMVACCEEKLGQVEAACQRYVSLLMREKKDDYSAKSLDRLSGLTSTCHVQEQLGPDFYLAAGEVCLWNHKYQECLRHLAKIPPQSESDIVVKVVRTGALCLFSQRNYEGAVQQFERFKELSEKPEEAAWAEMYLGHCNSRLGRHGQAVERYKSACASSLDSREQSKAAYLVGRELEAAGEGAQARAALESSIERFPEEVYAAHARWRIALALLAAGALPSAKTFLSGLVALAGKTPYYESASYLAARVSDLSADYDVAAKRYATTVANFPNSYFGLAALDRLGALKSEGKADSRALARLAKSALRSAQELCPQGDDGGYIGLLREAQVLSKEGSRTWRSAIALRDTFLKENGRTAGLFALNGDGAFAFMPPASCGTMRDVASFFVSLGMDDKGGRLLRSISVDEPGDLQTLYATIKTFERVGRQDETILLAERAFKSLKDLGLAVSDLPRWFVEALYPRVFSDQVERMSKAHNVQPAIVYAIIREESRFQVESVSSSAARGVMQLIAPTATHVAQSLGLDDLTLEQLYVPKTNIELGVAYLRRLLDRFDGRLVFALAAYNGGPGNVQRWLKTCPSTVEDEEFINMIPFAETRRYTQKVLASYHIYKWLYSSDRPG